MEVLVLKDIPANDEADALLKQHGWEFLGTDDIESGYSRKGEEETLIVAPSGNWRHIIPTSYTEHIDAEGSLEDLKEFLDNPNRFIYG